MPRRWGSYTRGEMYIAYSCPWRQMNRLLETAISEAAKHQLALTIRFSLWRDELRQASMAETLARFASPWLRASEFETRAARFERIRRDRCTGSRVGTVRVMQTAVSQFEQGCDQT
jgi:hypothetical protein